jgi:predicted dehydrogenase
MVGGGPGAFIGAVHRVAARLDDRYELVAGVFSSDPAKSRQSANELHVGGDRCYGDFASMARYEAARADGIDAVAVVTPNHLHFPVAKAFLEAGIHVICDKPMTTRLEDALALAALVREKNLVFGLTHNYSGYPLVRQAREMVRAGELGSIRVLQAEYAQDWLSTALERTGQKQAAWRSDPRQSGPGGSLGDIGTHAFHLAHFISGLACSEIAADVATLVPGRQLDDNVSAMLRFSNGARGMLWASQVAVGNENNLRIRVCGEKAGLDWRQEEPNTLVFTPLGKPPQLIRRGAPGAGAVAAHATRIPAGHPEGYLESFAQLYTDLAEQIAAKIAGRAPSAESLLVPTVYDGVDGVRFIETAVRSFRENSRWVAFESAKPDA